jgi:hypothetical protein
MMAQKYFNPPRIALHLSLQCLHDFDQERVKTIRFYLLSGIPYLATFPRFKTFDTCVLLSIVIDSNEIAFDHIFFQAIERVSNTAPQGHE